MRTQHYINCTRNNTEIQTRGTTERTDAPNRTEWQSPALLARQAGRQATSGQTINHNYILAITGYAGAFNRSIFSFYPIFTNHIDEKLRNIPSVCVREKALDTATRQKQLVSEVNVVGTPVSQQLLCFIYKTRNGGTYPPDGPDTVMRRRLDISADVWRITITNLRTWL